MAEKLTVREHDVARLLIKGLSNKLIAATLDISEHTAKFHMFNLITKLDATNRVEAAVAYVQWQHAKERVRTLENNKQRK